MAPEYEWAPSPDGTKLLVVKVEDGRVTARERFSTPGEDMIGSAIAAIRELWSDDVDAITYTWADCYCRPAEQVLPGRSG